MDLAKEKRAFEALTKAMTGVEQCRVLFDEAGLEYPATLRRMLGQENGANGTGTQGLIKPPASHSRPPGVADSWICVPVKALTPQTLALGILRDASKPMPVKEMVLALHARGVDVHEGSVANMGPRLEHLGIIRRPQGEGWVLTEPHRAPVLKGEYAWGNTDVFNAYEIAARRREAIAHVLNYFRDGLQQVQILTQMEGLAWLKTSLNKDLVKSDIEDLQREGRVRRVGNSKKWTLTEDQR